MFQLSGGDSSVQLVDAGANPTKPFGTQVNLEQRVQSFLKRRDLLVCDLRGGGTVGVILQIAARVHFRHGFLDALQKAI